MTDIADSRGWRGIPPLAQDAAVVVAIAIVTAIIYAQAVYHQFLTYDDPAYVTQNAHVLGGLSRANLAWAFTTGTASNWHPLTWLSHMVDAQYFGANPAGHHAVSVVLHGLNSIVLFLALKRLTGARWASALVAALFLVHPLHVESVAWISERKDLLSAFFFFAGLWAYARYAERPNAARYVTVTVLFALGLLSKPMLVTMPFVLLLLDYWPLQRMTGRTLKRLALEKAPWFALSFASSIVTFMVQRVGGAVRTFEVYPLRIRLENAAIAYAEYLCKMVWPHPLVVYYPHAGAATSLGLAGASMAALLLITGVVWMTRGRGHLLVGWLWYLGMMVPVIGIVQVGTQAFADRYTYLPLIGIFMMGAWELARVAERGRAARLTAIAGATLVLTALAVMAWTQLGYWHDGLRLFSHAAANTQNNTVAYGNLAQAYFAQGDLDAAERYAGQLLSVTPDDSDALSLVGAVQLQKGNFASAEDHLRRAITVNPNNARAHNNLAGALANLGKLDEAIAHLEEAVRLAPDYEGARNNLERFKKLRGK